MVLLLNLTITTDNQANDIRLFYRSDCNFVIYGSFPAKIIVTLFILSNSIL